tara:strand:- start:24 stop:410 length:387 start_codon:yes stop_codon:yes gene_type:complete
MAKIARYHGFKEKDGTIINPYLPTPRTFMRTDEKVVSYQENVDNDEMTIVHLMSKDGNNWVSVDNAHLNAKLKKKYALTEETNNYIMQEALKFAPKCQGNTDEENEDWGIKVDAEKIAADQKTYEDSL